MIFFTNRLIYRKSIILLLFTVTSFFTTNLFSTENKLTLNEKIKRYAGYKAQEYFDILENSTGDTLKYAKFILENCSYNDLAALSKEYLLTNIKYAMKTKEFIYTKEYDEKIFKHFVLPHRISQEPLEDWRERFYTELYPIVKDVKTIEEAALLLEFWTFEQMTFKSTHRKDQGPITTLKRGVGRCEEMMIIYIAALRSVGIPARSASVPMWNFTNNNHAWTEIYTKDGWKFLESGSPAKSVSKTWFGNSAQRATIIQSRAFGNYYENEGDVIKQKDSVTTLSSIKYYANNSYTKFSVVEKSGNGENNKPVNDALVTIYASSWGGIFPMTTFYTGENGIKTVSLGKGSVFVTAKKDSLFGYGFINNLHDKDKDNITLEISTDGKIIDEKFLYQFPLAGTKRAGAKEEKEFFPIKFDLKREVSKLRRLTRLNNFKSSADFAKLYDITNTKEKLVKLDSSYYKNRKEFILKADKIAENIPEYKKVINSFNAKKNGNDDLTKLTIVKDMIEVWDIKELIEIPDSSAIKDLVDIYFEGKKKYQNIIEDSIFVDGIIAKTKISLTIPENGWQKSFYEKIKSNYIGNKTDSKERKIENLRETVKNILAWIDDSIEIDKEYRFSYFSGFLNPNEILILKYIPKSYKTKLIASSFKLLGIPVRWKGRLEYFDGEKFTIVDGKNTEKKTEESKDEVNDDMREIKLSIFVDNIKIKAEPWDNFLFLKIGKDEDNIRYTYFEGELDKNDSLTFNLKIREEKDNNYYITAMIRNGNGDTDMRLISLEKVVDNKIEFLLNTPTEHLDFTNKWERNTIGNIKKFMKNLTEVSSSDEKVNKILFIRNKLQNEPEVRMFDLIKAKTDFFEKNSAKVIVYSEDRNNDDIVFKNDKINKIFDLNSGKSLLDIKEDLTPEDYPIIFLLNERNDILFSSQGYNMGIADLLVRKVKESCVQGCK